MLWTAEHERNGKTPIIKATKLWASDDERNEILLLAPVEGGSSPDKLLMGDLEVPMQKPPKFE
jgi:hypothetical protein